MVNFSKLSHLSKPDLRGNQFTSTFPTSLYSCQFLKAINLASNNLEEQIHPQILSLKSLSLLSLGGLTNINRAMEILMRCQSLQTLVFIQSRIIGQIPRSLGTLPKLLFLSLAGNQISGEIPKELYGLPRLLHEPTTTQVVFYIDLPMFSPADLNCL
ncbi:hypothetical protein ACFX13_031686 [Malus domestica]